MNTHWKEKMGNLNVKNRAHEFRKELKENSMERENFINQLPEEILLHFATFLSYQDVARLSMTCHHMKGILPIFKCIKGPIINEEDPRYGRGHWLYGSGPFHYFDTPTFTSKVKELTISMKWKDQVSIITRFL